MARKSGKTRTPIQQEYYKQRIRISRAIKRMEKQGYIFPEFTMPSVPKKITKSSISRLQKITPKSLREKYGLALDTSTGEVKEAQAEFNRRRIQSAQQAVKARKLNKAQRFIDEYFPTQTNIVINNYSEQINGKEYFKELLEYMSESPPDEWYKRSKQTIAKVTRYETAIINLLKEIIASGSADDIAKNIFENGMKPLVQQSIDKIRVSYEESEVEGGMNTLLSILKDNNALSAREAYSLYDRSDDDGYDYD